MSSGSPSGLPDFLQGKLRRSRALEVAGARIPVRWQEILQFRLGIEFVNSATPLRTTESMEP